jgi:uncharacterized protein (TIGR03437 family)
VVSSSSPVAAVTAPVTVTIGNLPATVIGAALAPGSAGLYQIAVRVPASVADGDQPVVAQVSGIQSPANALLGIRRQVSPLGTVQPVPDGPRFFRWN